MNPNHNKIQKLTIAAILVAIELAMAFTPIGYLPIGALSITTMHLPVLFSGMALGPAFGAGMGFLFGLTSFIRATFEPGVTSFVFTPFVSVAGIQGNFSSLIICFVPRIVLGLGAAYCFNGLRKLFHSTKEPLCAAISAGIFTVVHTVLVLGGIYVFFADKYSQALNVEVSMVKTILLAVVSTNMLPEVILACIAVPALYTALRPILKRMQILY